MLTFSRRKIFFFTPVLLVVFYFFYFGYKESIKLNTLYGDFKIEEPVLKELLENKYMLRLKDIKQYGGFSIFIKPEESYDRYEHSVGVFVLLRKYGAPLQEQVAGLLHDVSHTVFSHLGDRVFNHLKDDASFQDENHEYFLKRAGLDKVLEKYNYTIADIHHKKNKSFTCLEKDLPDINADRLEYNLNGGLRENLITKFDLQEILNDLNFVNGVWYFTSQSIARKFANISLYLQLKVWATSQAMLTEELFAKVLRRALDIDYLSLDEVFFGIDKIIWEKLNLAKDEEIQNLLKQAKSIKDYFEVVENNQDDFILKRSFKGIDPLVKIEDNFVRLSDLDSEFKNEFFKIKEQVEKGVGFKIKK